MNRYTKIESGEDPRAVVLMLHGGDPQDNSTAADWRSWINLEGLQRRIAKKLNDPSLSLWLLKHSIKGGWDERDPGRSLRVTEARAALDEVEHSLGVPVILIGHSMGGRTAIHVADHASVLGVIALSPWVGPEVPAAPLRNRYFAATSGNPDVSISRDGGTPHKKTREFLDRAKSVTISIPASFMDLGFSDHNLLLRRNGIADFAASKVEEFLAHFSGEEQPGN